MVSAFTNNFRPSIYIIYSIIMHKKTIIQGRVIPPGLKNGQKIRIAKVGLNKSPGKHYLDYLFCKCN